MDAGAYARQLMAHAKEESDKLTADGSSEYQKQWQLGRDTTPLLEDSSEPALQQQILEKAYSETKVRGGLLDSLAASVCWVCCCMSRRQGEPHVLGARGAGMCLRARPVANKAAAVSTRQYWPCFRLQSSQQRLLTGPSWSWCGSTPAAQEIQLRALRPLCAEIPPLSLPPTGSSTASIVVLANKKLFGSNLGDSGFMIIRNGEVGAVAHAWLVSQYVYASMCVGEPEVRMSNGTFLDQAGLKI